MAEECTGSSVVTSPTPQHSWWDVLHPANSISSWTSNFTTTTSWYHHQHHQQNPNSNSSNNCDQDDVVSISNASNHSGLTVDSSGGGGGGGGGRQLVDQPVVHHPTSTNDLIGEHASDTHLWSHVLSSVGSNGDLRSGQDVAENLFEAISSKTTSMFEPACDYLKKIDTNNWEIFPNSFNNFVKNLNGYTTHDDHDVHNNNQSSIESNRLSNLVSNWSIAPPDPHISLAASSSSPLENYSQSQQPVFCGMTTMKTPVFLSCYNQDVDVKMEPQGLEMEAQAASYLRRAFKGSNNNGYHHNLLNNNSSISMEAADNFFGSSPSPCTTALTNYTRLSSKPLVDIHASNKPCFRGLNNFSASKKQGLHPNSLQTRSSNGRTQGITNEGKKKRGEETSSDTVLKRPKHENSTASSAKMHAPKVKLGDRITALQQIVSPFGKTDTASVLLEAIGYINFLQEQVQLLSNPYMKPNSHKDPWGSLERKDQKGDMDVDLRSRGLCLVPISCTPQVYHETTGSDYWTPTYRGCLYR